jgi:pimeloyl-ACP methyl ester carboxylesterase
VLALLDAAGVQQAALVGHSLGSLIALEAAAQAPQRASRLVMMATAFPMKVSAALLDASRDEPLKAIDMVNAFSHSTIGAKPAYPGPGSWLHGGNRALMRRLQAAQTQVNLFENDFRVCDAYAGGLAAAERVQCPATVVLGERDAMTAPKSGRALATALKARLVTAPAGHALMQEASDEVLNALKAALLSF